MIAKPVDRVRSQYIAAGGGAYCPGRLIEANTLVGYHAGRHAPP